MMDPEYEDTPTDPAIPSAKLVVAARSMPPPSSDWSLPPLAVDTITQQPPAALAPLRASKLGAAAIGLLAGLAAGLLYPAELGSTPVEYASVADAVAPSAWLVPLPGGVSLRRPMEGKGGGGPLALDWSLETPMLMSEWETQREKITGGQQLRKAAPKQWHPPLLP